MCHASVHWLYRERRFVLLSVDVGFLRGCVACVQRCRHRRRVDVSHTHTVIYVWRDLTPPPPV